MKRQVREAVEQGQAGELAGIEKLVACEPRRGASPPGNDLPSGLQQRKGANQEGPVQILEFGPDSVETEGGQVQDMDEKEMNSFNPKKEERR